MNAAQFQPGLSMIEFHKRYGSEATCRRALYRARWPKIFGVRRALIGADRRFDGTGRSTISAVAAGVRHALCLDVAFSSRKVPYTSRCIERVAQVRARACS